MQTKAPHPLDKEEFKAFLKKHKLKATPQRLAVHEAMLNLGHASADMITEYIEQNCDVKVTVASVYNILLSLAGMGVYSHRLSYGNKMYFDVNSFSHAHLYDTVNNSYKDVIDEEMLAFVQEKLSKKRFKGYKIDGVEIQILCHPTRRGAKKSTKA